MRRFAPFYFFARLLVISFQQMPQDFIKGFTACKPPYDIKVKIARRATSPQDM